MHPVPRKLLRLLLVSAFVTTSGLSLLVGSDAGVPRVSALSDTELAATWGGVYGGRVGQNNKGILELGCGTEDLWPGGTGKVWENGSGTSVSECDLPGRPHFLPRYASAADAYVVVGGVVTKLQFTGGTPRIRVFVNGSSSPVATVPCTPLQDYPTGTAFGVNSNPNRNVQAYVCPDNGPGQQFGVPISLANAGLHAGLNAVRAVTEGATGIDDNAQDQEVRFFCVGDGDCLPARIELKPVANGALNQFEWPPPAQGPHWQHVDDYPDPENPQGSCAAVGIDFVGHASLTVKTELFQLGGVIPPNLTFSQCTLKAHMRGSGDQCTATTTYLVVRNSAGTMSDGPVVRVYYWDFPQEFQRKMTINPFTGTAWKSADFATLQAGVKDDATNSGGMDFSDLLMECTF